MVDVSKELLRVLDALGESSKFCTSGSLSPVLPGLEVKGIGAVGIPVTQADAKRLIKQATRAPYGRGEDTLVDLDVRRVWQLEPRQFSLRNTEWDLFLKWIIDAVKQEFGIDKKVEHELYKLLVYEKGSFFAPHRDSEKTPGMFATLVVCLPSRHEGGTLQVSHDGQTVNIDFGGDDAEFKIQYAAFYADCQHEIKPVTAGHRVCLVYNLALARSKQPSAPQNSRSVEKVVALLPEFFADESRDLSKLVIPLEHQYTEAGLSLHDLKGRDRSRVDVLLRATERLDYQFYLALLTHYQQGEADDGTWGHSWHRSRRTYRSYGDDDESGDSDAEMGEVYEEELSLDYWLDSNGRKRPLGKIRLAEEEILGCESKEDWPCEQEIREATGNEGVTMERWYRRSVIVVWPRDRYFRILASEGQATAIPALKEMIAKSKDPAADEACRGLATQIIECWKAPKHYYSVQPSQSAQMLKLLDQIGSPELVGRFIKDVLPADCDGTEGRILSRICGRLGWQTFAAELRDFFAKQSPEQVHSRLSIPVSICESLCCGLGAMTKERRAVCAALTGELEDVINRWDSYRGQAWIRSGEDRAGITESVIHAFSSVGETDRLDRFLSHVLADKQRYGLHKVLIPAVKAIHKWIKDDWAGKDAYSRLIDHCTTELRTLTATPIEPPGDWSREANLDCKCPDCRELIAFLQDPLEKVHRFPVRKDRRQHLHQQIDRHHCDLTHVTERKGSPQTLVCTKTQASYERRLEQFAVDTRLLTELEKLGRRRKRSSAASSTRRRSSATH
jgi:hypothetical protein